MTANYEVAKIVFTNTTQKIKFIKQNLEKIKQNMPILEAIAPNSVKEEAENIKVESDLHAEDNAEYTLKMSATCQAICKEINKLENREAINKELLDSIVEVIKEKKKGYDKYLNQSKTNWRVRKLKSRVKKLDNQIEKITLLQKTRQLQWIYNTRFR